MSGDASSVMHLVCARKTSEKSSSLGDFQQDLALSQRQLQNKNSRYSRLLCLNVAATGAILT